MKATITKYLDFKSLKEAEAAEAKAQKPAAPGSRQPNLIQAFVAQFSGNGKGGEENGTPGEPQAALCV